MRSSIGPHRQHTRTRLTDNNNNQGIFMMGSSGDQPGPANRSRRRLLQTSSALLAGSLIARQAPGSDATSPAMAATSQVELPVFNATRCTNLLAATVAPDSERFPAWNTALKASAGGREAAFVDLDAVDHNLQRVGQALGATIGLRLCAKSLPSLPLLEYLMVAACTNRIMAFSEGMVRDLLLRFGDRVDILLGRPATVEALARTFATLDANAAPGDSGNPSGLVRWLVDTPIRMQEYAAFASGRGEQVRVAIELDVGLHRGGARTADQLLAMLDIIDRSEFLQFAGFMGYEGHVPFVSLDISSPEAEFAAVQARYADYVRIGQEAYPGLFAEPLVFNSGGSRTYHYYTDELDTPVNEVALGSALFYPSNFHNLDDSGLRSATFFATPVLRKLDPAEGYPDPERLPALAITQPDYEAWYVMVSGGFPGDRLYPAGLVDSPTAPGGPTRIVNMMPNQGRWLGSRELPLEVGDFIFFQPWEADAVRWLAYLDVFRGDRLVDQWPTFQPGIRLT